VSHEASFVGNTGVSVLLGYGYAMVCFRSIKLHGIPCFGFAAIAARSDAGSDGQSTDHVDQGNRTGTQMARARPEAALKEKILLDKELLKRRMDRNAIGSDAIVGETIASFTVFRQCIFSAGHLSS
jgi:hypothetical protein